MADYRQVHDDNGQARAYFEQMRDKHQAAAASATRTVLEEAADIVGGDRQADYGHPSDNHGATAEMWTVYLRRRYGNNVPTIDAYDVCHLNGLQKHVRDAHKRKRDNLVDIAGYMANAEMCDE